MIKILSLYEMRAKRKREKEYYYEEIEYDEEEPETIDDDLIGYN